MAAKVEKQVRKRKPKANQSRKTEKYEEDRSNAKNVFKCEFCDFRYTKGPKVARNHYTDKPECGKKNREKFLSNK